jgi:hypothetical protein
MLSNGRSPTEAPMKTILPGRLTPIACAAPLLLLLAAGRTDGCWKAVTQSSIARRAPIIVLGEIVAVDVAAAQTTEGGRKRYLDGARIRVDKVYKNDLTDVQVAPKGEITAFMHSINKAVPGSQKKDGTVLHVVTSTDLRYKAGTRAVWFVFVQPDGRLVIHCHPQQCLPLKMGDAPPRDGAFAGAREKTTRAEWARQDRSSFRGGESKAGVDKRQ